MKAGVKPILAALALLFGSALLLASVHAQSSFTHNNNLIANSVTALSVATGGTTNFVAALQTKTPPPTCEPEDAEQDGDAKTSDGKDSRNDSHAHKASTCKDTGDEDVKDGDGNECVGTIDRMTVSLDHSLAEEEGTCEAHEKDSGKIEMARFTTVVLRNNAFGAYTSTWTTATGQVYGVAATLVNGSTTVN
jgi:hypothetical protein